MRVMVLAFAALGAGCLGADPIRYPQGGDGGASGGARTVVKLPFAVSDAFVPNGFMGDAESMDAVTMKTDTAACKQPRPPAALGACYRVDYVPRTFVTGATHTWAGIYWLGPSHSWGEAPGQKVEPGATRITFWAAGLTGQESVSFRAGGIKPSLPTQVYTDSFDVSTQVVLSADWARYTFDMAPHQYDEVLGAFSW